MEYTPVTADEIAGIEGLADWRVMLRTLVAQYHAGSFPAAAGLVSAITEAAEAAGHHPDLDVRYPGRVRVTLTTHAVGGLTTRDVDLAHTITRLAAESGATPEAEVLATLEIAIDTMDPERIRPFWEAVLGYQEGSGQLDDPLRIGPALWFQQMDEPRRQRNRIHFDVTVPHDVAERRVAAALAAGGTLVCEARARAFWTLADAEGNEVCVCTWQDRD